MRPAKETGILTVAAIRGPKGKRVTEYRFNEREQIFTLPSAVKSRAEVSKRLKDALKKNLPVKAVLDPRRGVVQRIDLPSPRELDKFARTRTFLDKPDKTVRVDVSSIDPTTFNIVDRYLKFPTFFTTDPATDATLSGYKTFTTCP